MLPDSIAHAAASAATGAAPDHPGVIARPPRIAYLFLGIGAILGWLWPLPLLPPARRRRSATGPAARSSPSASSS